MKSAFICGKKIIRLEREPQFRTDRSTIINSLLRETVVIASEVRVSHQITRISRYYNLARWGQSDIEGSQVCELGVQR